MFGRIHLWRYLVLAFFLGRECFYYAFNLISSYWSIQLIYSLMVFSYLCIIHWDFPLFISYFVDLSYFSPVFSESGQRFVNFVYTFNEPDLDFIDFFFCVLFCFVFRAAPKAYGSSQAKDQIGAIAAGLFHSHSNVRPLTHWARPGIEPTYSWILVRFVNCWATEGTLDFFSCFLNLYFIYFLLDIYDFLPSADFWYCLFLFF